MERTCSETVTLSGLPPLLGTKLLHCGGQLFIQLYANALTLVDNKGKETDELFREVLQICSAVNEVLHHVCILHFVLCFQENVL